jgi:hypothetical protein
MLGLAYGSRGGPLGDAKRCLDRVRRRAGPLLASLSQAGSGMRVRILLDASCWR